MRVLKRGQNRSFKGGGEGQELSEGNTSEFSKGDRIGELR